MRAAILWLAPALALAAGAATGLPVGQSQVPPLRADAVAPQQADDPSALLLASAVPAPRASTVRPVLAAPPSPDGLASSLVPPVRPALLLLPATPALASSVLPPARPETDAGAKVELASAIIPAPPGPAPAKGALCGDPALVGQLIAPIRASNSACGLDDGVKVTQVAGLALTQPATIDCPTARALSGWVQDALLPAARKGGMSLAKLEVADSYACRPRNNVRGNKMSEHGKGHAIDISALVLKGGDTVNVLRDWGVGAKGRLLATVRRAACGPFTTVLGPGSDRFHRNHLHFDTARGRNDYCH